VWLVVYKIEDDNVRLRALEAMSGAGDNLTFEAVVLN
jgi:CRISPR/Cas system-associated endoribonuclease Cas2